MTNIKRTMLEKQKKETPTPKGVKEILQPTSKETKRVQIIIPAELHKTLKMEAAEKGTTITQIIISALTQKHTYTPKQ